MYLVSLTWFTGVMFRLLGRAGGSFSGCVLQSEGIRYSLPQISVSRRENASQCTETETHDTIFPLREECAVQEYVKPYPGAQ